MTAFIAEISSNHNRSLDRALALVDAAADFGFQSVKFQLFRAEDLFHKVVLDNSRSHRERGRWELPFQFLPKLSERAFERGLGFSVTPFSIEGALASAEFVDFFKVASYELLWDQLLSTVAATGKPVILSSGMASMEEVSRAVRVLFSSGCTDVTVLHCLSAYPAPSEEANLAAIATLQRELGVRVGWSDHSRSPGVIHRAVHRWNAEVVEMHLDLDGEGFEFAPGHCWLPDEAGQLIREIVEGFGSDGSGIKEPAGSELQDRDWRADPSDGLRPLRHLRSQWSKSL